jgi:Zn finger protein HypA/HybF involved in hydrogenase expression
MALTAFCATCRRNVYIEEDDTFVCPVCSSPLLETAPVSDAPEPPPEPLEESP